MRKILAALATLAPTAAFAHPGDHQHLSLAQSAAHLLAEPDHQLALAGLVVAIATGGWIFARAGVRRAVVRK